MLRLQYENNTCQHDFLSSNIGQHDELVLSFELHTGYLPARQAEFRMRSLIKRRHAVFLATLLLALIAGWLYWNRPQRTDMALFAPANSLAFVECNDLAEITNGIDQTQAWQTLAPPIGAPSQLSPSSFWVALARWTGIGTANAILFARSQAAVVFSGAEGSQTGSTLTIKPLTTFIVETHTSQRRMKTGVEHHLEDLARRIFRNPVFVNKTVEGYEFQEWTSDDAAHQIVFAFLDTAVIVGNDEASVLHSIQARTGSQSLQSSNDLKEARERTGALSAAVFGFVTQPGLKSTLQGYALYRSGSSSDAVTSARIFADTFGGMVQSAGWSASFHNGMVEDRCSIKLADGVANKLRTSATPDRGPNLTNLPFVPEGVQSVSLYQ